MPPLRERNAAAPTIVEGVHAEGPAEISAAELHAILASPGKAAVVIVDVRPAEEYAAAHIPGSVNKPFQELDYAHLAGDVAAKAHADGGMLVFVSAQSPDVDDLAAREYMNEYAKTHGAPSAPGAVRVLLGGVCNWLQQYPA